MQDIKVRNCKCHFRNSVWHCSTVGLYS